MKKTFFLTYAAVAYLLGSVSLVYLAGFLIDVGVPKGINDGEFRSVLSSLIVDACLIFGFGLHHSITARSSFKLWWTRWIPEHIERATYVGLRLARSCVRLLNAPSMPASALRLAWPTSTALPHST